MKNQKNRVLNKKDRLAKALRSNLIRRKAQARQRQETTQMAQDNSHDLKQEVTENKNLTKG